MTPDLSRALVQMVEIAAGSADPWWIIGSAAVLLHGGEVGTVKDIDLMMSERDAEAFLRRARVTARGGGTSDRFRSAVFGTWHEPPVPVEIFGGFELATAGEWRAVTLATREPVTVGGAQVYVPSATELAELLVSFGRSKDIERARLLRCRGAGANITFR